MSKAITATEGGIPAACWVKPCGCAPLESQRSHLGPAFQSRNMMASICLSFGMNRLDSRL